MEEFDSEFCNVKYIECDNVVLITWKKFCCGADYRSPAMIAAKILQHHANCDFICNAKNGFEDDPEDIKWGFEVLLPEVAKSDCTKWAFIVNEMCDIEGELDLWTKEIQKYVQTKRVLSYEEALDFINE